MPRKSPRLAPAAPRTPRAAGRRRGLGHRLASLVAGWLARLGQPASGSQDRLQQLLFPAGGPPSGRAQWRAFRARTLAEANRLLAAGEPAEARSLLCRALLTDPDHVPYQKLLHRAIEKKQQSSEGDPAEAGRNDADGALKQDLLRIEAFIARVDELESVLNEAGVPDVGRRTSTP